MQLTNTKEDLEKWAERLRDPWRLRMAVTGLCLAIGYLAIYTPLSARLDETQRQLDRERTRHDMHQDVEFLSAQVAMFGKRLPENTDSNQWVQYVIDGIRQYPLKLVNLDSKPSRGVGPYRAIAMQIAVEGEMHDLDSLLYWLETNERLFRIESAKIEPARDQPGRRSMQILLLGLKA